MVLSAKEVLSECKKQRWHVPSILNKSPSNCADANHGDISDRDRGQEKSLREEGAASAGPGITSQASHTGREHGMPEGEELGGVGGGGAMGGSVGTVGIEGVGLDSVGLG
jgi:hypothetical protein